MIKLLKNKFKTIFSEINFCPRYYLLFKRLNFKIPKLILDAGCGAGGIFAEFKKQKSQIIGLDQSFDEINKVQLKFKNGQFLVADIRKLPFKAGSFDLIICLEVLCCVKELKEVFIEFNRLLKPKGKLIISVTQEYDCTGKLFALQRVLRRIIPRIFYTHNFAQDRSWLDYTKEEMASKLAHLHTYTLEALEEKSRGIFTITYYEYFIKLFMAMARDLAFGVKGFYYSSFIFFPILERIEHYFFKKLPGYSIFVEFVKDENSKYF